MAEHQTQLRMVQWIGLVRCWIGLEPSVHWTPCDRSLHFVLGMTADLVRCKNLSFDEVAEAVSRMLVLVQLGESPYAAVDLDYRIGEAVSVEQLHLDHISCDCNVVVEAYWVALANWLAKNRPAVSVVAQTNLKPDQALLSPFLQTMSSMVDSRALYRDS